MPTLVRELRENGCQSGNGKKRFQARRRTGRKLSPAPRMVTSPRPRLKEQSLLVNLQRMLRGGCSPAVLSPQKNPFGRPYTLSVVPKILADKPIVLINASHSQLFERTFWKEFVQSARKHGQAVVDLNFRKVDPLHAARTFVYPARLSDLNRKLSSFADKPLPPWADNALVDIHVDWERRRWQENATQTEIESGCRALCAFIDAFFQAAQPSLIVTTNKIDHPNHFGYLAAHHYGIPYRFAERSPLNTYIIEKVGMFSESGFPDFLQRKLQQSRADRNSESKIIRRDILKFPYGFRSDEARIDIEERIDASDRPLFFLPLDNLLWTGWAQLRHPQGNIDYPVFRDPREALTAIHHAVTRNFEGELIVKPHPSCREWQNISADFPEINFVDGDLDALTTKADVILTFLTKVAYLGLAKGKPVVSFGAGPLDGTGATYQVQHSDKLDLVLAEALEKKGLQDKISRFNTMLPIAQDFFFAGGNSAYKAIHSALLQRNKSSAEKQPQCQVQDWKATQVVGTKRALEAHEIISVVFDVTRLLDVRLENTGISRYIQTVARRLARREDVNTYFVYTKGSPDKSAHLACVEDRVGGKISKLDEVLFELDKIDQPYIFHSPINPFPNSTQSSNAIRVITVHDVLHLTMPVYRPGNYITSSVVNSIDPRSDALVFVSSFSMREFEGLIGERLSLKKVIHLAADEMFGRPDPQLASNNKDDFSQIKYLVFAFQDDPRKGFPRMVRVARKWAEKELDRGVVVFGPERLKLKFSKIVNGDSEFDSGKIHYVSAPSDSEVAAIYSKATAHLYLSEAEGFGLPPLEAMMAGTVSLMLDNTSLKEVYKDWPLKLANDSTDADILDALERLSDSGYRQDLQEKASSIVQRYTWEQSVDQLCDFYREVAARSVPRLSGLRIMRRALAAGFQTGPSDRQLRKDVLVNASDAARPFYADFSDWLMWRSPRLFRVLQKARRSAAGGYKRAGWGMRKRAPIAFRITQMLVWATRSAWRHKLPALLLIMGCAALIGAPLLNEDAWSWRYLAWPTATGLLAVTIAGAVLREALRRIAVTQSLEMNATVRAAKQAAGKQDDDLARKVQKLQAAVDKGFSTGRVEFAELAERLLTSEKGLAAVRSAMAERIGQVEDGSAAMHREVETKVSAFESDWQQQADRISILSGKLTAMQSQPATLDIVSGLRALRPLWFGLSAVDALRREPEVEHGHAVLMAVLADEARGRPDFLMGKTLIEIGTTREHDPRQSSTQKLGLFTGMMGMHFVTVDMDPANTQSTKSYLSYFNPVAQAVTAKGEDYLAIHAGPIEFVYLDAFDFDHGKHSEERQERYKKNLHTTINDFECWKMHEACARIIIERMPLGGIVAVDDTWDDESGNLAGKGKLAVPLLVDAGFEIVVKTRMTIALKRTSMTGGR